MITLMRTFVFPVTGLIVYDRDLFPGRSFLLVGSEDLYRVIDADGGTVDAKVVIFRQTPAEIGVEIIVVGSFFIQFSFCSSSNFRRDVCLSL